MPPVLRWRSLKSPYVFASTAAWVAITEHVAEGERDSAPEHAAVGSISSGNIRLRHRIQAEPRAVGVGSATAAGRPVVASASAADTSSLVRIAGGSRAAAGISSATVDSTAPRSTPPATR